MLLFALGCRDRLPPPPGGDTGPDCTARPWWPDTDRDGFGDDGARPVLACEAPDGHAPEAGDCDDRDPDTSPAALEVCDGVDQDCDGAPDQGVEGTWYEDADQDGFGVTSTAAWGCGGSRRAPIGQDCDDADPDRHPAAPLAFVDVTRAAGLGDALQWDVQTAPPGCPNEPMAGGGAVGDFDGDGFPDVFVARMYLPDLLFRNRGDGTFEEVGAAWGVDDAGPSGAAVAFDLEGDGDVDLFVVPAGPAPQNRLYVNVGGRFREEAAARGVAVPFDAGCRMTFSASAGDADDDGDLDLALSAWQEESLQGNPLGGLFLNDGTGHFVPGGPDLSRVATFTPSFVDADGDGDTDLSFTADWGGSALFARDGGGWTDVTAAAGVGTEENGMGGDWADVDGDGDLDWFVTSVFDDAVPCPEKWGCSGNRLYRNDGGLVFTDVTDAAGVRDGQWGWGAAFFDADLDGWLDLAQAGGFPVPEFAEIPSLRFFHAAGAGAFVEDACGSGLHRGGEGRAVIPFDLELDGDEDLLVVGSGDVVSLWRNDTPASGLRVELRQPGPNPFGVGAAVALDGGPVTQVRRVHLNATYGGAGDASVHLAGTAGREVVVTWPDGGTTRAAAPPSGALRVQR